MHGRDVQLNLLSYGSIQSWVPTLGDVIFKDGLFNRWCAIIDGIKGDTINVIKSGNMHLMLTGEHESDVINVRSIKSSKYGKYLVINNGGAYFV